MTEQNVTWEDVMDRVEQLNNRIMAILRVLGSQKTEQEKRSLSVLTTNFVNFRIKTHQPCGGNPALYQRRKNNEQ